MSGAPATLHLLAEDADDLQVVSAVLQDAIAQVGDIRYEASGRRLSLVVNRFRWEEGASKKGGERIRSALQVLGVLSAKAKRLRREPKDAVVSILSVDFVPSAEPPGGVVVITFAGGGELRLDVECVDAILSDLSAPWPTPRRPDHDAA